MALKFHFTPADTYHGDGDNPHAKASTRVEDTIAAFREKFGPAIGEVVVYADEHTVMIDAESIVDVCRHLKEHLGFNYLVDLAGVDRFTEEGRFEVYYNLVNVERQRRIRLKVRLEESHSHVPSVAGLFKAADWNERECYDMFGITFTGHEDLRRDVHARRLCLSPPAKGVSAAGNPGITAPSGADTGGPLTMDPFAAARGSKPVKSYEEPRVDE